MIIVFFDFEKVQKILHIILLIREIGGAMPLGGGQLHKIRKFWDQKLHIFGAEGAENVEFLAPQAKFLKICFLKIE